MKNSIVNRAKLIYIPLLICLIAIFTVSISSFLISKSLLLEQMKQDGMALVDNVVYQIEKNKLSLDSITKTMENDIRKTGNIIVRNQKLLSNQYLKELAEDMHVNEINFYNNDGKIIYSNFDEYVGWIGESDHSSQSFKLGNEAELMEEVRKDVITGEFFKYGYIRSYKGGFVQVGILWDQIKHLQEKFSYQVLVEELAKADNIVYVTILDKNLMAIADSDVEDIGIIYDPDVETGMLGATNGNVTMEEWYYDRIEARLLEITVPVSIDGEINNVMDIGFSMEKVYDSIYRISISSAIIAALMFLLFMWIQSRNIIKPVNRLNQQIKRIDLENNMGYRLNLLTGDTFGGLTSSINNILDKTDSFFKELSANQEELSGAYQQLSAADEELRAQFDEIQSYTEKMRYLADHDSLTNQFNRRKFMEKIEDELASSRPGAVMLLDLDNFKGINDTMGHLFGDEVLKRVADELENIRDERVFISRFGGDEFLVLITDQKDVSVIDSYAKKITDIFKKELIIEEDTIYISCSMGITLYPFDSDEVGQLIMNADMAMYKVKNTGKNNYMFFDEEMTENLKEQIKVEKILRDVVCEKGFKLLYQPQVDTFTGKIVGFEALLRLKDYNISPAIFIPIAEEIGLIIEIGRWVTKEAIKQAAKWKCEGYERKPIAINFSVNQLNDEGYLTFLEDTLKEEGVDANYINIEITESIFVEKREETIAFLNKLKARGIKIALDDFGTGYSSLNYLTFLPVDKIKLDKSLTDKFLEIENVKVMDSLISLAHSLSLEVVAEGIESVEQYMRLKVGGCNQIQGYLFSRPLEVAQAEILYGDNFLEKILDIQE